MNRIDRLISLVEQGHDPKLLIERLLLSFVGQPAEVSVRRVGNASTTNFLGGTVIKAETDVEDGKAVVRWTVADRWSGRKITGV